MDTTTFFLSFVFGVIGVAYFVYGKKQSQWSALAAGGGLCVFPYFVSNLWLMIVIGFVLVFLPFVIRE